MGQIRIRRNGKMVWTSDFTDAEFRRVARQSDTATRTDFARADRDLEKLKHLEYSTQYNISQMREANAATRRGEQTAFHTHMDLAAADLEEMNRINKRLLNGGFAYESRYPTLLRREDAFKKQLDARGRAVQIGERRRASQGGGM